MSGAGWLPSSGDATNVGWGYPDYAQIRLYYTAWGGHTVHCGDFNDPAAPVNCKDFPWNSGFGSLRVSVAPKTTKLIMSHGSAFYCADTSTSPPSRCAGWGGEGPRGIQYGQPIPIMDDRGITVGYCGYNGAYYCYSLSDGAESTAGPLGNAKASLTTCGSSAAVIYPMHADYSHLAFYEKKTYVQTGNFQQHQAFCCIDGGNNGNLCSNFPAVKNAAAWSNGSYGVVIDPANRGGCHWSLGDHGKLNSFSTIDPTGPCSSANPVFYVTPQDSYCGSGASPQSWASIELKNVIKGTDTDDAFVTAYNSDGGVVVARTALTNGAVSLGAAAVSGNTATMKFEVEFVNAESDLFDKSASRPQLPQVDIKWAGDAMQVCVTAKTEVTPQFCAYDGHAANALELLEDMTAFPSVTFMFTNKNPPTDTTSTTRTSALAMLDKLILQFESLLVVNPVVPSPDADLATFGLYAKKTGGILMEPAAGATSADMSTGIMSVIDAFLVSISGRNPTITSFDGFKLYDVSEMTEESVASETPVVPVYAPDDAIEDLVSATVETSSDLAVSAVEHEAVNEIGGDLIIESNGQLGDVQLPGLVEVGGDLVLKDNPTMEWEKFENLEETGGEIVVTDTIAPVTEEEASCPDGMTSESALTGCVCPSGQTLVDGTCTPCTPCPFGYSEVQPCSTKKVNTCVKGTKAPTAVTDSPTTTPTTSPTVTPTVSPTESPTMTPTRETSSPTVATDAPTSTPTITPAVDVKFIQALGESGDLADGVNATEPEPSDITRLVGNGLIEISGPLTDESFEYGAGWPMEGAEFLVSCEDGYELQGESNVTVIVNEDGSPGLSAELPECSAKEQLNIGGLSGSGIDDGAKAKGGVTFLIVLLVLAAIAACIFVVYMVVKKRKHADKDTVEALVPDGPVPGMVMAPSGDTDTFAPPPPSSQMDAFAPPPSTDNDAFAPPPVGSENTDESAASPVPVS